MNALYVKSLHIIFVVTWFAGLFYIPRLFIYHVEAQDKPEPDKKILSDQLKLMQKRLWYIIAWPGMVLTILFGLWMAYLMDCWVQPWFVLKFSLVVGLMFYHLACGSILNQLQKDVFKYSSLKLRIWNEVATLFLFAIVFIVVLKDTLNFMWGILGLVILITILLLAIRIYKNVRLARENKLKKGTD